MWGLLTERIKTVWCRFEELCELRTTDTEEWRVSKELLKSDHSRRASGDIGRLPISDSRITPVPKVTTLPPPKDSFLLRV